MNYRELKSYKYQLKEKFCIQTNVMPESTIFFEENRKEFIRLEKNGYLTIFEGYSWDGASAIAIDGKTNLEPSLVHDALTQLWENNKLTDYQYQLANDFFRWHLMQCGMSKFRAWYYWKSVSWFGKLYSKTKKPN